MNARFLGDTAAGIPAGEDSGRLMRHLGHALWSAASIAIVFTDERHLVRGFSPGAERLFGWRALEVVGRPVEVLLPGFRQQKAGGTCPATGRHGGAGNFAPVVRSSALRSNGERVEVQVTIARMEQGAQVAYALQIHYLGDVAAYQQQLERLAYYDPVTNLPNRAHLMEQLRDALAQKHPGRERLALLFIDCDRFKQINDTLGHERGDEVLGILAQRLTSAVRPSDSVGRYAGDEFLVLMKHVPSLPTTRRVAERIRLSLREPVRVGRGSFRLSVSIGIALYPGPYKEPLALLRSADSAMYRVKRAGGDAFGYPCMALREASEPAVDDP